MILTAHQNNFFPYIGVLDKAKEADIYVVLDHVQFTRNNYHNRFNLDGIWYTMSVSQRLEPLAVKVYRNPQEDWQKIRRKLSQYDSVLRDFDDCIGDSLVGTNKRILRTLFDKIDVRADLVSDYPTCLSSTERLIDLCKHYGCDEYLSGPSGRMYIDESRFAEAGIKLSYFEPQRSLAAIELLKEAS